MLAAPAASASRPPAFFPAGHFPGQSIAFWDATHGLATDGPDIGRTDDGGRTWYVVRRGRFGYREIAVQGSRDAWAVVDINCQETCRHPGLIRSGDGGRTWYRVSSRRLEAIDFATPSLGWALLPRLDDTAPALLATNDGGVSWRSLGRPCRSRYTSFGELAPSFLPRGRGWIVCDGQPGAGSRLQDLLTTADGGRHWRVLLGWRKFTDVEMRGLCMASDGSGWIWGYLGLAQTANSGRTWKFFGAVPGEIQEISRPSPRVAFILTEISSLTGGDGLALYRTTNGGRTWQRTWFWKY